MFNTSILYDKTPGSSLIKTLIGLFFLNSLGRKVITRTKSVKIATRKVLDVEFQYFIKLTLKKTDGLSFFAKFPNNCWEKAAVALLPFCPHFS